MTGSCSRRRGVEDDRRFSIVDEQGRTLNAKRVHAFVSERPVFDDATRALTLRLPDRTQV